MTRASVRTALAALLLLACDRSCEELGQLSSRGDLAELERRSRGGADLGCRTSEGWSPLHYAARAGRSTVATWLLDHGADLEARGLQGRGPLYEAAKYGHVETARALLDAGAAVDARSDAGFTPLIVAAERRHHDVIDLLLARGADVNAANHGGVTPLLQHVSHAQGHDDDWLVRLLVEHGAWTDVHDASGVTPLHSAARRGLVRIATALLDAGANPSAVSRGYLPINSARAAQSRASIDLLERRATWHDAEGAGRAQLDGSIERAGRVVARSGPNAPALGDACTVTVRPVDGNERFNCQIEARCGERRLYGGGAMGFVVCWEDEHGVRAFDAHGTPEDGDPAAMIDLASGVFFADDGVMAPRGTSVQVRLDAP